MLDFLAVVVAADAFLGNMAYVVTSFKDLSTNLDETPLLDAIKGRQENLFFKDKNFRPLSHTQDRPPHHQTKHREPWQALKTLTTQGP